MLGAASRKSQGMINWKKNLFIVRLAKSTPDDKRGLFLGWATSAKSFGWFLCSLTAGGVGMLMGVRAVYLTASLLFLLLIPIIHVTIRQLNKSGGQRQFRHLSADWARHERQGLRQRRV